MAKIVGHRHPHRAIKRAGLTLGTLLLFLVALVVGVLVHVNTPTGRQLVMKEVNALLAPSFKGKITLRRLDGVGVSGIRGVDATIEDPSGRDVIRVRGARAGIFAWEAVRSALLDHEGPLIIRLRDIHIDDVDVRLDTDPTGRLDLLDAFDSPVPDSSPPNANARGLRLVLSDIDLRHAWAHGLMAGAPPLDADLDHLRGSMIYAPDVLDADVASVRISARRLVEDAGVAGILKAHLRLPSADGAHPDVHVEWDGAVGGLAETVDGSFAADRVDAVVDVPDSPPEAIRTLWPDSPIGRHAQLHLEAHGPRSDVRVGMHAGLGQTTIDSDAHVRIGDESAARVTFRVRDLDVNELAAGAPRSHLGFQGEASAAVKADGALTGKAKLLFLGGVLGEIDLPPATLDAQLVPGSHGSAIEFQLDAEADDFQRVPQLGHGVEGKGRLLASGEVDLARKSVAGMVRFEAQDVAQGTTRVRDLSVEVSAEGPLARPEVEATVVSRGVLVGGVRFDSALAQARGAATAPHITASLRGPDTPDVDAAVDLRVGSGVSLDRLRVDLARGMDRSRVTARSVKFDHGNLSVDQARVEGLGAPLTADISIAHAVATIKATTTGIDLARLARLAHLEKQLKGGSLAIDADVHLRQGAGEGKLAVDLAHASAGNAEDVSGHLDLSLAGRTVTGKLHVDSPGVGAVDVVAPKVTVAGEAALTAASWRRAFGSADIDLHTDLARLAALVPPAQMPLSEAKGDVTLKGHLARDGIDDLTPDVKLEGSTKDLVLAARVPVERDIDGVLVHPPPAWRVAGLDFDVDVSIDGRTGAVQLSTKAHDAKGALAQLNGSTEHFPFAEVFHDPARLMRSLMSTRFGVDLFLPERSLASLPSLLRQRFVTGRMQATLDVQGTMLSPTVDLSGALRHAGFAGDAMTTPLDLDLVAHYDGRHGTGSMRARTTNAELLDLEVQADASASEILGASGGAPPWTASARAHLASFPLGSIAVLDDKLVSGDVSGDLTLSGLHQDAHVDADVTIDALTVGSIAYESARLQMKADGRVIDGSLRIDQTDGFGEAKAHAAASWGAAMAPKLDPSQPLDATVAAKNLRIAALLPFVDGFLDELDGRIDTNTKIELDPRDRAARLQGDLVLTRGTVEASAGGGELHDITAKVKLSPDGTITLEKMTAAGMTGRLEVVGNAHLQGTLLQSAHATITIPHGSAIPFPISGTELGDVDGRIDITASSTRRDGPVQLKVDVPHLDVKLSEASTATPQSLGPMDNVRIGAHRGDPARFVLLPLDPVPNEAHAPTSSQPGGLQVAAHLGAVHVVRGTQLAVDLQGDVKAEADATTRVTGQILIEKGGMLDVQGRKFTVEGGTVTFTSDPANPQVVVKAAWTASDGTVVVASFTGPLKTGKVTLTSEPQLTRDEIVQVLLFGTANGKQAQTPSSSTANSAIATAGGEAAQPLNHMFNQLGLGAVTANVDTSEAATPKPEVEVQIAKDISLQIAVVLGQPPPGVNPDRTLVTLDWRFLSMWSLASTVGDAGTTIFDLLWQRRY